MATWLRVCRSVIIRESSHACGTGSGMSEEASRWNQDKERWDKLWRGAKVRAAPIPKALTFLCTPLRLDKRKSPSATFLSFYLAAGMTVPVNGSGIYLQQDQGVSDFASALLYHIYTTSNSQRLHTMSCNVIPRRLLWRVGLSKFDESHAMVNGEPGAAATGKLQIRQCGRFCSSGLLSSCIPLS